MCGHIDNIFEFSAATTRDRTSAEEKDDGAAETAETIHPEGALGAGTVGSVQAWVTVIKNSTEALVASDHCSVMADITV